MRYDLRCRLPKICSQAARAAAPEATGSESCGSDWPALPARWPFALRFRWPQGRGTGRNLRAALANVILSYPKSARLYYELDIEPKSQIRGGETWRNIDATPLVEFYPHGPGRSDGRGAVGYTRQKRSRTRSRSHLGSGCASTSSRAFGPVSIREGSALAIVPGQPLAHRISQPLVHRRSPVEPRDALSKSGRAQAGDQSRQAVVDRTLYLFADVEFFYPLGEDVPERFVTKRRFRGGFGFRLSHKWRFEVLHIRDTRARDNRGRRRH